MGKGGRHRSSFRDPHPKASGSGAMLPHRVEAGMGEGAYIAPFHQTRVCVGDGMPIAHDRQTAPATPRCGLPRHEARAFLPFAWLEISQGLGYRNLQNKYI